MMKPCVLFFLLIINVTVLRAQAKNVEADSSSINSMVDNKSFLFVATDVTPMSGKIRYLTSEYDLKVLPDTISTYLPYFGRVTNPGLAIVNGDGGIKFEATDFTYAVTNGKKGRKNIEINIKGNIDAYKLSLIVFPNKKANLFIVSNGRQPISYGGYITEIKK
ncbi:MAG: DUF4251 domain-containing protein [Bacteroidetes bacterium]|nr:DUF4251 domain-containing protein [Bacteroidota bacterium]